MECEPIEVLQQYMDQATYTVQTLLKNKFQAELWLKPISETLKPQKEQHSQMSMQKAANLMVQSLEFPMKGSLFAMAATTFYAMAQQALSTIQSFAAELLFYSGFIECADESYQWVTQWLGQHQVMRYCRNVDVVVSMEYHLKGSNYEDASQVNPDKQVYYWPGEGTHLVFHKYVPVWISINKQSNLNAMSGLTIRVPGLGKSIIQSILHAAHEHYKRSMEGRTQVHTMDTEGYWTSMIATPKRPITTVYLQDNVSEMLMNDVQSFLSSEQWYGNRGVPYRRGYLLHGPPGTGKSSTVLALAGEFDLPLYCISLASKNLSDESLRRLISQAQKRSVILIEDVDSAFVKRKGTSRHRGLTFSGLINAIDGTCAQEGRLLFMTTNYKDRLEEALIRPGRVDVKVKLGYATKQQAKVLFKNFYGANAIDRAPSSSRQVDIVPVRDKVLQCPPFLHSAAHDQEISSVEQLSIEFSNLVPEGSISMAALQGLLLEHKFNPQQALEASKLQIQNLTGANANEPVTESHQMVCNIEQENSEVCNSDSDYESDMSEADSSEHQV